jgi:hypothetical protein
MGGLREKWFPCVKGSEGGSGKNKSRRENSDENTTRASETTNGHVSGSNGRSPDSA